MNLRPILTSILLTAALAGCATFSDSEIGQIRRSGVSPVIVGKMKEGRVLTPPDIIDLTRFRVPDDLIIRQIQDASVDYVLTRDDIKNLETAHVSRAVMDALIAESNDFASSHHQGGAPRVYAAYPGYPAYPYYDYYGGPYPYYPYGGAYYYGGWGRYHRWH